MSRSVASASRRDSLSLSTGSNISVTFGGSVGAERSGGNVSVFAAFGSRSDSSPKQSCRLAVRSLTPARCFLQSSVLFLWVKVQVEPFSMPSCCPDVRLLRDDARASDQKACFMKLKPPSACPVLSTRRWRLAQYGFSLTMSHVCSKGLTRRSGYSAAGAFYGCREICGVIQEIRTS